MAWHDAPCINHQALFVDAIVQIFYEAVEINSAHKDIYPKHRCKAYKIQPFGIKKFVITTNRLKIGIGGLLENHLNAWL